MVWVKGRGPGFTQLVSTVFLDPKEGICVSLLAMGEVRIRHAPTRGSCTLQIG